MPAAFMLAVILPETKTDFGLKACTWLPPPVSHRTSLPFNLMTNTVIGIGTNAVVSPASARACLTSSMVALPKYLASCAFSQMPSYKAVTSASPTLYRRKPGLGSGVCALRTGAIGFCWLCIGAAGVCWLSAGATMAKLLSRPSAAPATAADRIKSRRDVGIFQSPHEIPPERPPDRRRPGRNSPTIPLMSQSRQYGDFMATVVNTKLKRRNI